MPARVRLSAIIEGLEMQSDDMHAYLHRPTGDVIPVTDDALADAEEGDEESGVSPEELEDARKIAAGGDEYVQLPDRFEIDEYRMMERFALGLTEGAARDAALTALRGRGAFRYFKDTVRRLNLAESWYAYRDECYREVAREWCEEHNVEYDDHTANPDATER